MRVKRIGWAGTRTSEYDAMVAFLQAVLGLSTSQDGVDFAAFKLPDGRSWVQAREPVADLMIATVDRFAPGFARSVIARQILSPVDLEQIFGLVGGDIFHGALGLDQLFSARPLLGYAAYRGPIPGVYHCGSGSHPGGGVTGAPGYNAAREIVRDHRSVVRWKRWRRTARPTELVRLYFSIFFKRHRR